MSHLAESKIFEGNIASFRFNPGATAETFDEILPDFQSKVTSPKVDRMIVDVQMTDAWGRSIQEIWLRTGEVAEAADI